jgi:hypothetical protein
MSGFYSYRVRDPNYRLRFSFIVIMGLLAFGSLLYWRGALLFAADYQEPPVTHGQVELKNSNEKKQKAMENNFKKNMMKKYQLEE